MKKVFNILSLSFGICLAVSAFIFVFFCGMSDGASEFNLFYFFGDIYKDPLLEAANAAGADITAFVSFGYYFPFALATAIAAFTLVTTTVLSVMAVVNCIRALMGAEVKRTLTYAFAAFAVYLSGLLALHCLMAAMTKSITSSVAQTALSGLNGTSVAGISVCTVLAFVCVLSATVARGKDALTPSSLVSSGFSAGKTALLFAVSGVIAAISVTIAIRVSSSSSYSELGFNPIRIMPELAAMRLLGEISVGGSVIAATVLAIFSYLFNIATVALIATAAVKHLNALANGEKLSTLKYTIPIFVLCVADLAVGIVATNIFADIIMTAGTSASGFTTAVISIKCGYGGLIAEVVLAALLLAADIVRKVLKKI